MAVLFSLNGQVHGHFTSEFITRTLKMKLLQNYLLIHVDCTQLNNEFRRELFMASRDRMKEGGETAELRRKLGELLIKSELANIDKKRRNAISVEGSDAEDLLRAFSKNLEFNKELLKLFSHTLKIDQEDDKHKKSELPTRPKGKKEKVSFDPKRYPSFFKLKSGSGDKYIKIPLGEERTIQFATDVEDAYFDRTDDPGHLKVTILQYKSNKTDGGRGPSTLADPTKLVDINKSSPREGTIRISFGATTEVKVDDDFEISAILGGPEDIECQFWVRIVSPRKETEDVEKPIKDEPPLIGLPELALVYNEKPDDKPNVKTKEDLEQQGIDIDFGIVMHPHVEGEQLKIIYINMDSTVLRNYISRQGNITIEQKELAEKRYISSVYFHTIFLYTITKNKNYEVKQAEDMVEIEDYLKDLFSAYYCEFLLNFGGTEELIQSLSD